MSSIGSIAGGTAAWQTLRAFQRPDPAEMANKLFASLDAGGQGYLQKSDLQTAFDKFSTGSVSTTSVDDLFTALDSNSDGKVTKQEFSDTLTKVLDTLDNQAMASRLSGGMQGAGGPGGMPPPPPRGDGDGDGDDAGFTKDELQSQLSQIGDSDSARSTLISSVVGNFDKADTNGDGKVSFREAMAYAQSTGISPNGSADAGGSTRASAGSSSASTSSTAQDTVAVQLLRLLQAYGIGGAQGGSTLSVTA